MANTYKLIQSITVGSGGAANIEFTSIPGTYTDLLLKLSLRSDRVFPIDGITLAFNNSTSNFTVKRLMGDGTTATSDTSFSVIISASTATSNTFSNNDIYIPNYNSSNNKSFSADSVAEDNATYGRTDLLSGLWSDTSAITSIKLTPILGTGFVQYSTAYLYGISNA